MILNQHVMSCLIHRYAEHQCLDCRSIARDDLYTVLDAAPDTVDGVLETLRAGQIGPYYDGKYVCLIGTIGRLRNESPYQFIGALAPYAFRPIEKWFLHIGVGHTPGNNWYAYAVEHWILEWRARRGGAA